MKKLCLFMASLLLCPAIALAWEGKTKSVHDGDSLTVTNHEAAQLAIRLYGLDAPEYKQAFGLQAKKKLQSLVSRKNVAIEQIDTDRYGRNVALVRTKDGELVNEAMVRSGLAWVYDQYCTREDVCDRLRQAEAEARTAGRGLWAEANPTPPWEWRKEHKTEEWYAKPARAMKSVLRKIKVVIR
jgi:micrococcal nuclease